MAQILFFYKANILSEQSQNFSRENIHESLKSLFKGSDRVASDMIKEYFEEIEIDTFDINYEQLIKANHNFENEIKRIFDKTKSSFFLIDENIWNIIQEIIDKLISDLYNSKHNINIKPSERLQKINEICRDYDRLHEIYKTKLLMAAIA
jgi:hypothetical protein